MISSRIRLLAATLLMTALPACTLFARKDASPDTYTHITIDGDTAEWPAGLAAFADEHALSLVFTVQGEQLTLQSSPKTVAILLDVDASAATGRPSTDEPVAGWGVDLEIHFSPRKGDRPGNGVAMWALDAAGTRTPLKLADFDLMFAPTYASSWYEVRISRTPTGSHPLPAAGLLSTGHCRGVTGTLGADGQFDGWADPFTLTLDETCGGGGRLADQGLPLRADGTVRVVSWNVDKSSPVTKPESFKRVLNVLSPDIVLVQEWEQGDAAALEAWFEGVCGVRWHAVKAAGDNSTGGGVAVVSRFELAPAAARNLLVQAEEGERPVRFVSAVVRTPYGDVLAGSTHLKCCGTKGSTEDRRRMAEARGINTALQAQLAGQPAPIRVFGGDLNLVGSRPPLDLLRANLDADGSDMSVAQPLVIGDDSLQTWRDPASDFCPGRLDYLVYSDTSADVAGAFVLDTARWTDAALARAGLRREDSAVSDHLPVVLDLRRK